MRDVASMGTMEKLPEWRLHRHAREAELELTGDWIACETGVRSSAEVRRIIDDTGDATLRVDAGRIGRWDSALIAFVRMIRDVRPGRTQRVRLDTSGLPETARRLLTLATTDRDEAPGAEAAPRSLATRVGGAFLRAWDETIEGTALIGETAQRTGAHRPNIHPHRRCPATDA
jgi:phospholipid/cholesterol/gamma-HCH transport system permease protein